MLRKTSLVAQNQKKDTLSTETSMFRNYRRHENNSHSSDGSDPLLAPFRFVRKGGNGGCGTKTRVLWNNTTHNTGRHALVLEEALYRILLLTAWAVYCEVNYTFMGHHRITVSGNERETPNVEICTDVLKNTLGPGAGICFKAIGKYILVILTELMWPSKYSCWRKYQK